MARDPKTEPADFDVSSLPILTEQQMAFALEIMAGSNATDAYLTAYPTSQNWPRASVWAHASRTLNHDKVLAWINAWRAQAMDAGKTSLEDHTAQLMRIRELALASGNYGAAAKCEESRGRANGLYVDRIKTEDSTLAVAQVLERIAQSQPAVAAQLAMSLGVDLPESDNQDSPEQPSAAKPLNSLH